MSRTDDDRRPRRNGITCRTALLGLFTLVAAACTDLPLATETGQLTRPRALPKTPNATDLDVDRRVTALQIDAAGSHACVLESDNRVICWGGFVYDVPFNYAGQSYIWISTGIFADCGIRLNGELHCWRGGTPALEGTFRQVSVGSDHGCAIRSDQTVVCWGSDAFGKATPPAGEFRDVSAGVDHTCGIRTDNAHECWGNPAASDLDVSSEVAPDWGGNYLRVSSGTSHTCAINASRTAVCGGKDDFGQVSGGFISEAISISASRTHTCGVSILLNVHCWGSSADGKTTPPSGDYTSVATGDDFSCAITTAGNVRCWGDDDLSVLLTPYELSDPQTTVTTLEIDPRPSTFGAEVEMVVTVTVPSRVAIQGNDAEYPGTGRVTFIDGGTCAEPEVVLAADMPIRVFGEVRFETTALSVGTHSIGACYLGGDGLAPSGDGASMDVTAAPTTTTIAILPTPQQYSDRVTLEATVSPASVNGVAAAGVVQFTIGGALVGAGPVVVGANGKATLPNVQMTMAPGPHSVGALFTPDDQTLFMSSVATTASLTVAKEDASIVYAADNATALQVSTPGGTLAANALSLQLGVKETEPDAAGTGTAGIGSQIGGVTVSLSLVPIGPGSITVLACSPTGVSGTGYATTRSFTCTNPSALPVNVYAVQATLASDYYQAAQYEDVVTVYDPVAGFVTGGGTFRIGDDLVRFGINLKYKTNAKGTSTATQGSVFAVRHHANGRKSRLESNSLNSAVAIGVDATTPMGWAVLSGKATYTTWDAATSSYVTLGGQAFTVYVEDRDEPGAGIDRIWMGGPGLLTLPGTLATAAANAVTLTGGNVSVPHRAP